MLSASMAVHVLVLGMAEGPDLITLNPARADSPHMLIVMGRARRASLDQQLGNRVDRAAHGAGDRPHAHALDQQPEDHHPLLCAQLVHTYSIVKLRQ